MWISNSISGMGDQSFSVSHSHAVHLSESREERRREEEKAPTGHADLCCLFLLIVFINTHTLGKRKLIAFVYPNSSSFRDAMRLQSSYPVCSLLSMPEEVEETKLSKQTKRILEGWWKTDERKRDIGEETADWLCVCMCMGERERESKRATKKKVRALWLALDWSVHCSAYGIEPMMTRVTHCSRGDECERVRVLNIQRTYSNSTIARV